MSQCQDVPSDTSLCPLWRFSAAFWNRTRINKPQGLVIFCSWYHPFLLFLDWYVDILDWYWILLQCFFLMHRQISWLWSPFWWCVLDRSAKGVSSLIFEVTGAVTVKGSLFLNEMNGRSVLKTLQCLQSILATCLRISFSLLRNVLIILIYYRLIQIHDVVISRTQKTWKFPGSFRGFGWLGPKTFGASGLLELHGGTCRQIPSHELEMERRNMENSKRSISISISIYISIYIYIYIYIYHIYISIM